MTISLNLTSHLVFSQSDTPCGSTPLTLGTSCVPIVHDASADTKSTIPNPSCDAYYNSFAQEDTWYSFVAPTGGQVIIEASPSIGSEYDGAYMSAAVYTGSCASLTATDEIDCFRGPPGSAFPIFNLTGLTPGQTYYVRVWGVDFSYDGDPRTHDFCAYAPPAPPVNDECDNAIPAVVDTTGYCNTTTSGTIEGATESSESYFCNFAGGGIADDDVWFSFVATATTHYFFLDNIIGSTIDLSLSVHEGTYCNTSTGSSTCVTHDYVTGLTIGNTYYVRVWSNSSSPETSTFDLCITAPPEEPSCAANPAAGNTACTATPICNLDGYCGTTSSTYTADSWTELFNAAASCFPDIDNNSFLELTAIATEISFWVWVDNCDIPSGIQIMVFSANDCSSGPVAVHECYSPANIPIEATLITAEGLTIGDQYYIMIDGNAGAVCDYKIAAYKGIEVPVSVFSTSPTSTICLGSSIDLYATGGATGSYTWSPPANLNSTANDTVTSTPSSGGSYTYTAVSTSVSALCPATMNDFTFTVDACILSVELMNFDATYQSNKVSLNWATAAEINNDYFTIERSTNGIDWEELKVIKGAGSSSASALKYTTFDEYPYLGVSYYRLKQTDFEGQFEYSEIRSVEVERRGSLQVNIYPNPTKGEIKIVGSEDELEQISVYDMLGQDVTFLTTQIVKMESMAVLDLSNLSAGIYLVRTKNTTHKLYKE